MKHSPQLKPGGCRIELSMRAPSYIAAYVFANCNTGYLNPIKSGNLWTIKVNSLSIPKDNYFDYVMKMISLSQDKLNVHKKHDKIIKLERIQKIGLGDGGYSSSTWQRRKCGGGKAQSKKGGLSRN
ncbi:hypothetical protein VP01_4069g2 [Puccinia sorghi]|uniref:Uncharacterized protein n=1 Tax=Puccinia sorghi TaxID=27349 RepID=A0A0L6USC5_9BASI|nr:hypothetical protein VP01_4069g2 [Puccinia sorghi]